MCENCTQEVSATMVTDFNVARLCKRHVRIMRAQYDFTGLFYTLVKTFKG